MRKRCNDCGEVDPPTGFNKDQGCCRICQGVRARVYYVANRTAILAQQKACRPPRDKEKVAAWGRAYRKANPELVRAKKKAHYEANKEQILAHQKAQRDANPEKVKAAARARYAANPELYKAHARKRRARLRGVDVFETVRVDELYERDGGRCGICRKPCVYGEASVDHIVPIAHGGDHSYQNTQLAHHSCNISRGAGRRPAQARLMG